MLKALKLTLNHRRFDDQPIDAFFPFASPPALKPEPIDVDVKVVLVGDQRLYELFYEMEDDFRKIFKVRVEFDEVVEWSRELVLHYGGMVRKLAEEEDLRRPPGQKLRGHRLLRGVAGARVPQEGQPGLARGLRRGGGRGQVSVRGARGRPGPRRGPGKEPQPT